MTVTTMVVASATLTTFAELRTRVGQRGADPVGRTFPDGVGHLGRNRHAHDGAAVGRVEQASARVLHRHHLFPAFLNMALTWPLHP